MLGLNLSQYLNLNVYVTQHSPSIQPGTRDRLLGGVQWMDVLREFVTRYCCASNDVLLQASPSHKAILEATEQGSRKGTYASLLLTLFLVEINIGCFWLQL